NEQIHIVILLHQIQILGLAGVDEFEIEMDELKLNIRDLRFLDQDADEIFLFEDIFLQGAKKVLRPGKGLLGVKVAGVLVECPIGQHLIIQLNLIKEKSGVELRFVQQLLLPGEADGVHSS